MRTSNELQWFHFACEAPPVEFHQESLHGTPEDLPRWLSHDGTTGPGQLTNSACNGVMWVLKHPKIVRHEREYLLAQKRDKFKRLDFYPCESQQPLVGEGTCYGKQ